MLGQFQHWELQHFPRTMNTEADLLSHLTHGLEDNLEYISCKAQVVNMDASSIERDEVLTILPAEDKLMNELIPYKTHRTKPNPLQKKKVLAIAPSYQMVERQLYKISFRGSLLQCLAQVDTNRFIEEIHGGDLRGPPRHAHSVT